MTWMVTGGAGYIGSHVVRALTGAGMKAVALDDLSTGFANFVEAGVPLVHASILDGDAVTAAMREHGVTGVIHCAGYKYAGESVKRPVHTYRQNVEGLGVLLDSMAATGASRLVFSSSAGVFGTPSVDLVTEETPTVPESPYGESKLIGEWLIRDQVRALAESDAPLTATSLRYFNVVGSGYADIYDASPYNLFPLVFAKLTAGDVPAIFGDDYATEDGTCVRDYVHVSDLAHSHVAAARMMEAGRQLAPVYNLGSGAGTSVRQIMDAVREVTEINFQPRIEPRRAGDPARIVATGELAGDDIEWKNSHDVHDMVASAWASHPKGA